MSPPSSNLILIAAKIINGENNINAKNPPKPRFTSEELDKIMEFYKKDPDFVDALINHKISLAHRLIPKVKNDPKAMSFVTKNITKLSNIMDSYNRKKDDEDLILNFG